MDIAVLSIIKRFRSNRVNKISIKQNPAEGADGGKLGPPTNPISNYMSARCSPPPMYKSHDDLAVNPSDKQTVFSLNDV